MPTDADLDACGAILRAGSKSFALASRLLPLRVREPVTALYAFCRIADDEIDARPDATLATVDALKERLARIYAGNPIDTPVDRAMATVVERERIPPLLFDAFLEGLAWDATGRRYETLDDVYAYAARVAGTVGAMMTLLMGRREPLVVARACDLGVAMQLTNIARDVGEDAARGRIYLPLTWMRTEGLDPDAWLVRPEPSEKMAAVVARLLEVAERLYARADEGIGALPRDCRMAIASARFIYADIGRYVTQAAYDSVTRRAHVPTWRKIWLLVRALAAVDRDVEVRSEPPLEPTRFLVAASADSS